jgi:hypothetical protein
MRVDVKARELAVALSRFVPELAQRDPMVDVARNHIANAEFLRLDADAATDMVAHPIPRFFCGLACSELFANPNSPPPPGFRVLRAFDDR